MDEIVYKNQITHLLLLSLEIAARDVKVDSHFEENYRKYLKFDSVNSWKQFRGSVDVINDTDLAIHSFCRYQLSAVQNQGFDFGEKYLRLYGVLNAVYLQIYAYDEICKLLKLTSRKKDIGDLKNLLVYELRNKVGAHTTNYFYSNSEYKPEGKRRTSYRVSQMNLEKFGRVSILDEYGGYNDYDLLECVLEYEQKSRIVLEKLINCMIDSIVYKKTDKIEIKMRMDELLPRLVDYSTVDENKKYSSEMIERINKELGEG
ncbi:MAG: hypothetical protein RIF46_02365 [Cyclobacteriaceae bacterium]